MFNRPTPSALLRNLNWRTKALVVLFLAVIVFLGAVTGTQLLIGIPAAEHNDVATMRREIEQVRFRLNRRMERLTAHANALARSEAVRQILENPSTAETPNPAITELLREQQLDVVIIVGPSGQPVSTQTNDRRAPAARNARIEQVLLTQVLSSPLAPSTHPSAVLVHPRGLIVHARAAIVSRDKTPLGSVLVAEVAALNLLQSNALSGNATIRLSSATTALPALTGVRESGSGFTIALPNHDEIVGRIALTDSTGSPAGTMELRIASHVRGVVVHNARLQLLVMAAVSLVMAGFLWLLVEFAFVRRIEALTQLVSRLEQPDAIKALQSFPGSDEVGRLARTTGQMAVHLSEARDLAVSADRAKSAFLRIVSHELRTPMNGVIGFSTLLRDTPLTHDQAEYAKAVEESGHLMLKLIDDLLEYTAIEASGVVLNPRPVRVRDFTAGIMRLLHPRAAAKQLAFEDTVAVDVPDLIWADSARLQQVLVHLLNNAIKFTVEGGVRLQVEMVTPGATTVQLIRFRVIDSGIGIAPESRALLFRPLTPGDTSSSRKHGGMGMGLVICERLVAAMGGTIAFRSEPGAGTEFFFSLPVHHEPVPTPPIPPRRDDMFHRN